jgi:long-chain acyl-CoA synthetase
MTIREILETNAQNTPDKIFLYYEDITKTYAEIDEIANRVANALLSLNVKRGDNVNLLLTNRPEFIYLMFGLAKIGAVCCPINPALRPDEVQYIVNNSESVALITEDKLMPLVRGIREHIPKVMDVIVADGCKKCGEMVFDDLVNSASAAPPPPGVTPSDRAAIIYTSGTTGKPKGAMLSQANYIWDARAVVRSAEMTAEDRFMCILPLFHVNGQVVTVLAPLCAGASMVLVPQFSASKFFETVDKFKPTAFSGVPTIYAMLLNTPGTENYDLASLRFCICGAAPMPVEVFKKFEEKFNAKILEGYGLSEGTCASSINPLDGTRKVGSIGVPIHPEQDMKIMDHDNNEMPRGQHGEICVKGPNVMEGYYNNPDATEAAIKDGWLHTGDMGFVDEDGYFYISGRIKEMIIRGGENIYPKEIEEVIYTHPAVAEAAVIGVRDDFYGEEVKAVIVCKPGMSATEKEIMDYCFERLAKYKCPKSVAFIEDMPKTATGKIQKRKLVEDPRWTAE